MPHPLLCGSVQSVSLYDPSWSPVAAVSLWSPLSCSPMLSPYLNNLVYICRMMSTQVSDTHRLDDNKAERKRCEDAGFEVCRSTVDGKPVGPQRVWPGGLAMSRTIGDFMVRHAASHMLQVRVCTKTCCACWALLLLTFCFALFLAMPPSCQPTHS